MLHRLPLTLLILLLACTATQAKEDDRLMAHKASSRLLEQELNAFKAGQEKIDSLEADVRTVTRTSWFEKLTHSVGQFVVGLTLLIFTPWLIFWNEGEHVKQLKRIDFCENHAVKVDPEKPDVGNDGELVYFQGQVVTDGEVLSLPPPYSSIRSTDAVALQATAYIYQWTENESSETQKDFVGGGETTTTTWVPRMSWVTEPGPERLEHNVDKVNVRGEWAAFGAPIKDALGTIFAQNARVGKFGIPPTMIADQPEDFQVFDAMPLDDEAVPPGMVRAANDLSMVGLGVMQVRRHVLFKGTGTIDNPACGDIRVFITCATAPFFVSVVAQQVNPKAPLDSVALDMGMESTDGESTPLARGLDDGDEVKEDAVVVVPGNPSATHTLLQCPVRDDACCCPAKPGALGKIWLAERGRKTKAEMISAATDGEGSRVCFCRSIAFVLLVGGWVALCSPIYTFMDVLPFMGSLGFSVVFVVALPVSLVCCCTFMACAYIRFRPLLATTLLFGSSIFISLAVWFANQHRHSGGALIAAAE